ncbi:hypothetical protein ZOSMA_79G00100 [Zostera marina]|uniref:Uncharacterized protein n=1 Tax=Zostera marina TaxID=29655 RepID=A0A0K9NN26_ZOSMR|nr:hypothetical protein ZOSMA_79G00100 [Zostera marina]
MILVILDVKNLARDDDIETGRDAKKNSVELVLDEFFKQVIGVLIEDLSRPSY